jgi:hypothetical protein
VFINESDRGINPIASGMDQLLSAIYCEDCLRRAGWMDTAEVALYPVAAMEEARDQSQEVNPTGDGEGKSFYLCL